MSTPKILIGADPELFVRSVKSGKLVSAHDLLPGTKEEPHPVRQGAIQVDGTAAEFNILPAPHADAFCSNISVVMSELKKQIGPDYELVTEPVAFFDEDYFKSLPEKATELGCNPDYNAWTGQVNDPPDPSKNPTMRTASGHIHIGWTKDQDPNDPTHQQDCNVVAQNLDYWLGIMSMMWDRDGRRRELYGKAGAIRYKPYGVEYRVMSNKWLSDPMLGYYIQSQVYTCLNGLFQGSKPMTEIFGDAARKAIDTNDILWWDKKDHPLYAVRNHLSYPDPKYYVEPVKKAEHSYDPNRKTRKVKGSVTNTTMYTEAQDPGRVFVDLGDFAQPAMRA